MTRVVSSGARVYAAPLDLATGLPTGWVEVGTLADEGVFTYSEPEDLDGDWDPAITRTALQGATVTMKVTMDRKSIWVLRELVRRYAPARRRRSYRNAEYRRRLKRRTRR